MRIIPKKTKVKVEFYRNFTLTDIIIALIGFGIEVLLLFTNFGALQYVLMAIVLGLFICLYLPVASEKLYMQIGKIQAVSPLPVMDMNSTSVRLSFR